MTDFVSRAGNKLEHALAEFGIEVTGLVCADFGSNTGGFVDCLLRRGAAKVYAIDTGYGVLEWKLRKDSRVVAMERTNAMHVNLPEPIDLVTIDVAWTPQRRILPSAGRVLKSGGQIVSLVKPHYETDAKLLRKGVLPEEYLPEILAKVEKEAAELGFVVVHSTRSPIKGAKGNSEMLIHLKRRTE